MPLHQLPRIRDPFILPHDDQFLLYGTTDPDPWSGSGTGFDYFISDDLKTWEGPFPAFRPPADFWATTQFWAPEVHSWAGRHWMFATFADDAGNRGTQVLVADDPRGPFTPWSDGPVTPAGWKCLDGTLHVDEAGDPWLVFCHEWLQAGEGSVYAQRLAHDLRDAVGERVLLFVATDAPWVRPHANGDTGHDSHAHITDGPFLVQLDDGALAMLWSSGSDNGYAVGAAISESGRIIGPWRHQPEPVYDRDGGHAMTFRAEGERLIALHQPNTAPSERLTIRRLVIDGSTLTTAPWGGL